MINRDKPTASCLLVSEPFMHDPNFIRSVVLLCQHDLEGTLGLVLNHRTNLLLKDLIDCPLGDFPVYLGGPVGMEGLQFIHTFPEKIDGGISLGNDLYWGGDFERVKELILLGQLPMNKVKFFIGYSGWTLGQLDQELKENSWMVCKEYHPDILFLEDVENLWKEVVITMGPKYAHIANYPINPSLN